MSKLKVCVYAICKNEEQFVDRWMDSMNEADLVVVTDTGSTDGTVEKLRKRGAIVYVDIIKPWRFDTARNRSLDHVPEDADICVCTDLDEIFLPGWRKKLEAAWKNYRPAHNGPIAKSGRYLYNWSLKPDGTPDVQFEYFKVHERHGFRWQCPVHEHVAYTGPLPVEPIFIEGMVLNHYPDHTKSRSNYLPLLELGVEEDPANDRMRYYLGREYLYAAQWQKCIDTLKEYLLLPSATWKEERCAAMRWIAKSFRMLGQIPQAYAWHYRAIGEAPHMREPYVEFAKLCYEQQDWPLCFCLTKEALCIREKSKVYINMGYAWDATPDDLCSIAAFRLGLPEEALQHAEKALSIEPQNERIQKNLALLKELKKQD